MLADGFFAAVAAMGFAVISNPPKKVVLVAGALAAVGHMGRFALMREGVGIASASLCAALLISLCSMPCTRRWHIPAEMFAFPALLPMIPGMFAYKAILATMQFLGTADMPLRQELLVSIVYNSLTTFFIMCAGYRGRAAALSVSPGIAPGPGPAGNPPLRKAEPACWGLRGNGRGIKTDRP